jgi:hypothetical protein
VKLARRRCEKFGPGLESRSWETRPGYITAGKMPAKKEAAERGARFAAAQSFPF